MNVSSLTRSGGASLIVTNDEASVTAAACKAPRRGIVWLYDLETDTRAAHLLKTHKQIADRHQDRLVFHPVEPRAGQPPAWFPQRHDLYRKGCSCYDVA